MTHEEAVKILLDRSIVVTEARIRTLRGFDPRIGCDCSICKSDDGMRANLREVWLRSWMEEIK